MGAMTFWQEALMSFGKTIKPWLLALTALAMTRPTAMAQQPTGSECSRSKADRLFGVGETPAAQQLSEKRRHDQHC
jgi:hypothetical protein